jgi:hypothetical protein
MSTGPDQVTEQVLARARVRNATKRVPKPDPLAVVAVAFVAGALLAKLMNPRGHG